MEPRSASRSHHSVDRVVATYPTEGAGASGSHDGVNSFSRMRKNGSLCGLLDLPPWGRMSHAPEK